MKKLLAGAAVLGLWVGSAGAQSVDTGAAEALLKKSGCMKCHSVSADKDGPSFKKTAAKYKGKADAPAALYSQVLAGGPKHVVHEPSNEPVSEEPSPQPPGHAAIATAATAATAPPASHKCAKRRSVATGSVDN